MRHYNVSFTFEADDMETAIALVGTWRVTAGTVMMSIVGSELGLPAGPTVLYVEPEAGAGPTRAGEFPEPILVADALRWAEEKGPPPLERPPGVPEPPDLTPPDEVEPDASN